MKLKPLKQWMCDECDEVIEDASQGYLEWLGGDIPAEGFRVVHHASRSPRQPDGNCYCYSQDRRRLDMHLDQFVGTDGIVRLLALLDAGPRHMPDFEGPESEVRGWVELFRRLQIPYYEEARLYWDRADEDGFFDGANEIGIYLPENLKHLIERYGKKR